MVAVRIPLYAYQQDAVNFLNSRCGTLPMGGGLFMEMGTGKTRTALAFLQGKANAILIVCPLSVVGVWKLEVARLGLPYRFVTLTTDKIPLRAGKMREFRKYMQARINAPPVIVIVNYESFWIEPLRRYLREFPFDAVVMDEVHRIKSHTAKRSRFAHTMADRATVRYRLGLTGTPVTAGVEDLYSIYNFIDPNVFPGNWDDFQKRYLTYGGFYGFEITGYEHIDEIESKVAASAYQIRKSDALDLPERVDVVVPVELTPKTRAKYDEFRKEAVAEIEGTDENGNPVRGIALARIVLTTLLRLQQITGGFVNTQGELLIDMSDEKLQVAKDLTDTALDGGQQVVIFCHFKHDLRRLLALYPDAAIIAGSVPEHKRSEAIAAFQAGRHKVMLAQIAAGSLGIDLTAASVGIFYSTGYNLADFLQARDRLHRHGQTRKVTYYHLIAEDTVDGHIIKALMEKQSVARLVTRLDYAHSFLG